MAASPRVCLQPLLKVKEQKWHVHSSEVRLCYSCPAAAPDPETIKRQAA